MKKKTNISLCLLFSVLLFSINLEAQTYELPDTNFRNALKSKYPTVIKNGLLEITEAGKITGELNVFPLKKHVLYKKSKFWKIS